jgi:5-methylcytosine-specific restriction endonuclease McrA
VTTRRPISSSKRLAIFEAAGGRCHICGLKIRGKEWDVEHVRPLGLLGADDMSNLAPAHRVCHSPKTAADVASIAKAKRQKIAHIGAYKTRNPIPGSKRSKWKRKINGQVVLR